MTTPIQLLINWLIDEQTAGAPNPRHAVLSTATCNAIPHARIVALREINDFGLLFFTQRGTKKVAELTDNPKAALTFWFELYQREVIVEGVVTPLSEAENEQYWQGYSREAQIRFHAYAPTSAQPIDAKSVLENRKSQLESEYDDKPIPMSRYYCGFRLKPSKMLFYTYRADQLSDVFEYGIINSRWEKTLLSP